ncbi:hypothetical protein SAMN04487910_0298 [Aquimarina amphilecti]|uniref:SpoIIAA-like n=1 Tax=Aquimarina amphilecti TaxID=1038014 RepID=A0A1H7G772_AQUAM|nr:hypothetical protein [Aquimarina amphilecti]SEK34176.1 hypothetical protein SAMN04487910_0298 [Aquimarina amphilecti]
MQLHTTDFCSIELFENYVIITVNEGVNLTLDKANIIRKKLRSYYKDQKFLLISNRENNHEVSDDIYKQGQLSNMKAIAIVSKKKTERDKAIIEQKLFDKSFAFFENLEEAKSWAQSYF